MALDCTELRPRDHKQLPPCSLLTQAWIPVQLNFNDHLHHFMEVPMQTPLVLHHYTYMLYMAHFAYASGHSLAIRPRSALEYRKHSSITSRPSPSILLADAHQCLRQERPPSSHHLMAAISLRTGKADRRSSLSPLSSNAHEHAIHLNPTWPSYQHRYHSHTQSSQTISPHNLTLTLGLVTPAMLLLGTSNEQ